MGISAGIVAMVTPLNTTVAEVTAAAVADTATNTLPLPRRRGVVRRQDRLAKTRDNLTVRLPEHFSAVVPPTAAVAVAYRATTTVVAMSQAKLTVQPVLAAAVVTPALKAVRVDPADAAAGRGLQILGDGLD